MGMQANPTEQLNVKRSVRGGGNRHKKGVKGTRIQETGFRGEEMW